ncbi:MAG: hypothetical protein JWP84_2595 [Tardiphaga sp.]|nr:hypothetical protein [Tardiphaga sp.]
MINLLRQLVTSFLSTIAFFAAFAIAGDVLIAAVVAIASAAAQFVLATTTHGKLGGMKWASLAVILALTGTALVGDDVDASLLSPTPVTCTAPHCVCRMTLPI